jgi:hypothetical protein
VRERMGLGGMKEAGEPGVCDEDNRGCDYTGEVGGLVYGVSVSSFVKENAGDDLAGKSSSILTDGKMEETNVMHSEEFSHREDDTCVPGQNSKCCESKPEKYRR